MTRTLMTRRVTMLRAALTGLLLLGFAGACADTKEPCSLGGVEYEHGSPVPSGDCNSCGCNDGQVECTLIDCAENVACGGRLGDTCSQNQYCAYMGDCGFADGTSVCKARPDACDTIYAPVCGCDGATYANDCSAASAGVGYLHQGPCEEAGSCTVGGVTYPDGTGGITAPDGCNVCFCSNGQLGCTLRACAPVGP